MIAPPIPLRINSHALSFLLLFPTQFVFGIVGYHDQRMIIFELHRHEIFTNLMPKCPCRCQRWSKTGPKSFAKIHLCMTRWMRQGSGHFYNTERPHSALAGQSPAEAYWAEKPVDMMDKAHALPTSPQGLARRFGQAQQRQQDVINRILAA